MVSGATPCSTQLTKAWNRPPGVVESISGAFVWKAVPPQWPFPGYGKNRRNFASQARLPCAFVNEVIVVVGTTGRNYLIRHAVIGDHLAAVPLEFGKIGIIGSNQLTELQFGFPENLIKGFLRKGVPVKGGILQHPVWDKLREKTDRDGTVVNVE